MKKGALMCLLFAVYLLNGQQKITLLFTGTYTDGKPAKGIYIYKINTETGGLTLTGSGENITNPSFLALSHNGRYLYACTDTKTAVAGSISSFSIDSLRGTIRFINKQSSEGANPVYLAVDKNNQFVVAANYTAGSVTALPISSNGALNPAVQTIAFTDSSINRTRQEKAHIHSTIFSPGFDYLYLPDLGSDKIRAFSFNAAAVQPLKAISPYSLPTMPGTGPRHMVFHPKKKYAYCVEEMGGSVTVYAYSKGKLSLLQTINCTARKTAEYSSADIHISPDGFFLYASNRIENTIAIFSIRQNGKLTLITHVPSGGDVPRNFCIDPSGKFLLVANQASNNIVIFKRNMVTGLLQNIHIQTGVPSPSCLQARTYW